MIPRNMIPRYICFTRAMFSEWRVIQIYRIGSDNALVAHGECWFGDLSAGCKPISPKKIKEKQRRPNSSERHEMPKHFAWSLSRLMAIYELQPAREI